MASVPDEGGLWRPARRLMLVVLLALAGLTVSVALQAGTGVRVRQLGGTAAYDRAITALLAVGLYASALGISRAELRRNLRIILVAVTFGVAFKAVLTGSVMVLAYGSAGYLLLGVAVAQIDPISVAVTLRHSTMPPRAKSVLYAWASFDDPVTVLLVVYLASFTLFTTRGHATGSLAGTSSYGLQILLNLSLVAVASVSWLLLARRCEADRWARTLVCGITIALIAVAALFGLLIGITACGLFLRPSIEAIISRAVDLAFWAATCMLGMFLVEGVNVPAGVLLGVTVFAVQALTGLAISHGMPREDRVHLALGQQNGLTAIVLALALQPYLPSAVGIIAIAILVVNVLHLVTNGVWEHAANSRRPAIRNGNQQPERMNSQLMAGHVSPVPPPAGPASRAGKAVSIKRNTL